jgi:sterol desaturase/sphingolipid hydroxylase (fatty acid hydroxylase superfamily)
MSVVLQVVYMLGCVAALDLLHDAWFYWTHRLLHWRPLYKYVHWEHHRCVVAVHMCTARLVGQQQQQ